MDDRERGFYEKFNVQRINDPMGKHNDCRYFVIDLEHDAFAGPALRAYADACGGQFPGLAADLRAMFPLYPAPAPVSQDEEGERRER